MLNSIEVINSQGAILNISLEDESNGFLIQSIEGLDPVKATLVSSSFANLDGAQYHSSRREPRNIKIQLGLDPDYTTSSIERLRKQLYNFFMPKTEVLLRFYTLDELNSNIITKNGYYEIVGHVESCVSPPFTKDPTMDISLMCYDPDFIDPVPVVFNGLSTSGTEETSINYTGTVETGVIFTLKPKRSIDSFTIYHKPPDGTLRSLDFTSPLSYGDILKISTVIGSKSVIRTQAGIDTSLLYAMSPQSNWIELQPGTNYIRVYAVGAAIKYSLEYIIKHGGL